MPAGQENEAPKPVASSLLPSTVRHFKSMLDVEEPPKLGPWKPMSYEELYTTPMQNVTNNQRAKQPDKAPRKPSAGKVPAQENKPALISQAPLAESLPPAYYCVTCCPAAMLTLALKQHQTVLPPPLRRGRRHRLRQASYLPVRAMSWPLEHRLLTPSPQPASRKLLPILGTLCDGS